MLRSALIMKIMRPPMQWYVDRADALYSHESLDSEAFKCWVHFPQFLSSFAFKSPLSLTSVTQPVGSGGAG